MDSSFKISVEKRIDQLGITKYKLAQRAGIAPHSIYAILKNDRPSYDTMKKIVTALDGELIVRFDDKTHEL